MTTAADQPRPRVAPKFAAPPLSKGTGWLASLGVLSGFGAACSSSICVLPAALAGFGVGSDLMTGFDAYRLPLLIFAGLMTTSGWVSYSIQRRNVADCMMRRRRSWFTLAGLIASTTLLVASLGWNEWVEPQLMNYAGATLFN
jgi:hypothetical protein